MQSQGLYWHQREKLLRDGDLGPLQDEVSNELRRAALQLLRLTYFDYGLAFAQLQMIFGKLPKPDEIVYIGPNPTQAALERWFEVCSRDEFLTSLEVIAQGSSTMESAKPVSRSYLSGGGREFHTTLNQIFTDHRFGFEMSSEGVINRVGSPALHEVLVRPALLRIHDSRFSEAEDHFHKALEYYRGEDSRRCIFEAGTAVESLLKALGYQGSTLEDLAEDFRKKAPERGYIKELVPDVVSFLKKLYALRSDLGGHAAKPGEEHVQLSYALLSLHLSGALIVFLVDRSAEGM